MNKRLLGVVAFGVVVAALASVVLYRLIAARLVATAATPTIPVVVATRMLPIGSLVKDTDLKVTAWPGTAPQGATSRVEDVVGRGIVAVVMEGEPVIDSRLAPKGGGAGLAAIIPPGMRAVALSVNEVVGVAGFVVPGMRVDVLVSGNAPGSNNTGTLTRTVLQNIEVLSAGQNFQKDAEGKPIAVQVVNVLVTPDQAETLSLASQEMRIRLVLRNPLDHDVAKTSGTSVAALFGGDVKPAAVKPASAPQRTAPPPSRPAVEVKPPEKIIVPIMVEVIHGTKKTELRFQPEPEAKN